MAQLLSNLPVGAKVKFGRHSINGETPQELKWLVANISGNVVTLITSEVIDVRAFDARESGESYSYGGSPNYKESNIRQWLNSDNVSWYSPQHASDVAPSNSDVVSGSNTHYSHLPGFLYYFSTDEKNALRTTSVVTYKGYTISGTYTLEDKVFLPSATEVVSGLSEGSKFALFNTASYLKCNVSAQVVNYSLAKVSSGALSWRLRTPSPESYQHVANISADGILEYFFPSNGRVGVRPCISLGEVAVSDTTDNEASYTVVWNSAPPHPSIINVPPIHGGKSNAISWSSTTDPDGDTVTYTLECSINGGAYSQIYSGASTVYAHLVPFGTTSVAYRVKATDPSGESSAYTTSATKTVVNNNAPVISGSDSNLGVKSSGFSGTYTVTDANNNTVTVTESIDGVQIRSLVATLGSTITYGITGNTWLALANGSHTLTIRATDGIDSTVRTYTFTKLTETLTIRNSTPWVSTTMPSRIMLVITRNIPSESTFKVEVCNNGYDTTPIWEDCTDAVKSGLVHVFTNKVKTSGQWGVVVRVTVNRNGATGACYISAIGGNFE